MLKYYTFYTLLKELTVTKCLQNWIVRIKNNKNKLLLFHHYHQKDAPFQIIFPTCTVTYRKNPSIKYLSSQL